MLLDASIPSHVCTVDCPGCTSVYCTAALRRPVLVADREAVRDEAPELDRVSELMRLRRERRLSEAFGIQAPVLSETSGAVTPTVVAAAVSHGAPVRPAARWTFACANAPSVMFDADDHRDVLTSQDVEVEFDTDEHEVRSVCRYLERNGGLDRLSDGQLAWVYETFGADVVAEALVTVKVEVDAVARDRASVAASVVARGAVPARDDSWADVARKDVLRTQAAVSGELAWLNDRLGELRSEYALTLAGARAAGVVEPAKDPQLVRIAARADALRCRFNFRRCVEAAGLDPDGPVAGRWKELRGTWRAAASAAYRTAVARGVNPEGLVGLKVKSA